jgi:hypothetical protein
MQQVVTVEQPIVVKCRKTDRMVDRWPALSIEQPGAIKVHNKKHWHHPLYSSPVYTQPLKSNKDEIGNLSFSDSAKCTQNTVAA